MQTVQNQNTSGVNQQATPITTPQASPTQASASIQAPQPNQPSQVAPPPDLLAHSGEQNAIADIEATGSQVLVWVVRITSTLLTLQSLYNLYVSIRFVFIDIPDLEASLSQGLIDRDMVVVLAAQAVIKVISAMVSMFLAIRLTKTQEKVNQKIGVMFSLFMVVANTFIIDFFRTLDVDLLISDNSQFILQYFLNIPERLVQLIPFM